MRNSSKKKVQKLLDQLSDQRVLALNGTYQPPSTCAWCLKPFGYGKTKQWTGVTDAAADDATIRFTANGEQQRFPLAEISEIVTEIGTYHIASEDTFFILDAIRRGTAGRIQSITKLGYENKTVTLSCGHKFHNKCRLKYHNECPNGCAVCHHAVVTLPSTHDFYQEWCFRLHRIHEMYPKIVTTELLATWTEKGRADLHAVKTELPTYDPIQSGYYDNYGVHYPLYLGGNRHYYGSTSRGGGGYSGGGGGGGGWS